MRRMGLVKSDAQRKANQLQRRSTIAAADKDIIMDRGLQPGQPGCQPMRGQASAWIRSYEEVIPLAKIKITRKLLSSYRKLKKEIVVLELELVEMMEGDNGIGVSVVMDYRKGYPQPKAVPGFDWKLHDRRQRILDNKKARCKAVEDWIRSIEDGQARYVFRMFYIEGMTWDRIAAKIGYSNSPDYPRLYIRDKYLKEHNIL